jgi:hypothetical protein
MKNWKMWCLAALVSAVAITVPLQAADLESTLFTPAPEPKIVCEKCLGLYTTAPSAGQPSAWGFGSSCAAAQSDLTNQLWGQADVGCVNRGLDSACSVTTVVTTACYWSSSHGAYQVDGYANYKCLVIIC